MSRNGAEEEPIGFQHTRQIGHHLMIVFQVLQHVEEAHGSNGRGFKPCTLDRRTNHLGNLAMGLGVQRPRGSRLEQNAIEAGVDQCLRDKPVPSPTSTTAPSG